ncbi:hypothetical protein J6590_016771 [Homalodisca vitripennis]|nr:hypothetical protein J6590_016771 [Homalodisca vitripennis]
MTYFCLVCDSIAATALPSVYPTYRPLPDAVTLHFAISPTEGSDMAGNDTPCEESKQFLIKKIGGFTTTDEDVTEQEEVTKPRIPKTQVDDFVFHHISSIEGAMKIAAAKEKDDFSKDMLDVTSDREVEKIQERIRESREKENWRGLVTGVESGKRKHSSYLQPNTEITLANMSSARALVTIGLLKNGNLFGLKPLTIGKEKRTELFNIETEVGTDFISHLVSSRDLRYVLIVLSTNIVTYIGCLTKIFNYSRRDGVRRDGVRRDMSCLIFRQVLTQTLSHVKSSQ